MLFEIVIVLSTDVDVFEIEWNDSILSSARSNSRRKSVMSEFWRRFPVIPRCLKTETSPTSRWLALISKTEMSFRTDLLCVWISIIHRMRSEVDGSGACSSKFWPRRPCKLVTMGREPLHLCFNQFNESTSLRLISAVSVCHSGSGRFPFPQRPDMPALRYWLCWFRMKILHSTQRAEVCSHYWPCLMLCYRTGLWE